MAGETGELRLRLSDEDREQAVQVLNQAVADGRLSWDEHADRVRLVYLARTRADLSPQLADLGRITPPVPAQRVRAVAAKVHNTPVPAQQVEVQATFGAAVLNLSGLAPGESTEVRATAFCGKIVLVVSDDTTVVDRGAAVLGKRVLPGPPDRPGGPVVTLTGTNRLGKLVVFREGDRNPWVDWILRRLG